MFSITRVPTKQLTRVVTDRMIEMISEKVNTVYQLSAHIFAKKYSSDKYLVKMFKIM